MLLLAGDIGGTNTRLGVFEAAAPRPLMLVSRVFATLGFADLPSMISDFLTAVAIPPTTIDRACFGVAGPVVGGSARLTNVPWHVDPRSVEQILGTPYIALLNDLQAMAYSVPVLDDAELHTLQEGQQIPNGNVCLVAAGTGLGIALLHRMDGRLLPFASEGGHADFAARSEREIALLRDLTARYGRAEVEHVVSGPGVVNVSRTTHQGPCAAGVDFGDPAAPRLITEAARERRCAWCVEAFDMFVEAYGAEVGNVALAAVATGGVYIGGGIAPRILPALTTGRFLDAFRSKAPLDAMLGRMPVRVIVNSQSGLLGAAVYCANL